MSLTFGVGPLARPAAGSLNADLADAPAHLLYLHPTEKRIRGEFAGRTVVDTVRGRFLHETGLLPQWYLPLDDVDPGVLVASDHSTRCPFKGTARYWHVRVGDRVAENAIWSYPEPIPGAPPITGLVGFYLDRLDAWYEEDEPVTGHPRDPFHRVDVHRSSRKVRVRVRGTVVAETHRPLGVFETSLPVRWYVPREDVRTDLLTGSTTTSFCPYKGEAEYFSYAGPGGEAADVAWSYPSPLGEVADLAGYLSFWGDDTEVSAEL